MMSILVTGATTPIGERLVRSLIADTRVDHVLAVGIEPEEVALPFSKTNRLTYMQVDLRRSRRVHELLFGPAPSTAVATTRGGWSTRRTSRRCTRCFRLPTATRPSGDWFSRVTPWCTG
ncbi:MAG: hypothetical protein JRI25_11545 [Deltaproteobacteria bacterium]|nr:hypothetical protein [Deltaproteobacteria bacterium]